MSCLNPMIMAVVDTKGFTFNTYHRLEKFGWKFNRDTHKAYRLISRSSRNYPLEEIDDYMNFNQIEIPCGSCIKCRLDIAQDWAVRCTHEAKLYNDNYFITLTYSDEHLTYGNLGNPTLVKKDFQLFMKRLRSAMKRKYKHIGVRFFGCGEYGDINLRPHFHIILFNLPLRDLTDKFPDGEGHIIHKTNSLGLPLYYSELVASCWDKGFIAIDDANFNTESYVSRYILKKQKGENTKVYKFVLGVEPPFVLMSNRPGIGYTYFLEKKEGYKELPQVIAARPNKKPLVTGLPRYYKKKLFVDDPKLRKKFEDKAKFNASCRNTILFDNNTTINKQREIQEEKAQKISKIFKRDV